MGKLKLHRTGLRQPYAERMKIGDSWILKKDYARLLSKLKKDTCNELTADVMTKAREETCDIQSSWMLGAFALALHREYGWDTDNIARALAAVDAVAGEITDNKIPDILKQVEEETGVKFV